MLLPAFMVCVALLVQPACLLYTRAVMQAAAAEGCRLVATSPESLSLPSSSIRGYVLRRLSAVPDVAIFHVGGPDAWDVSWEGATSAHEARVTIEGSVRPLPLLGVLPALLGETDADGNVIVRVEVSTTTRAPWVEGGYGDWSNVWS